MSTLHTPTPDQLRHLDRLAEAVEHAQRARAETLTARAHGAADFDVDAAQRRLTAARRALGLPGFVDHREALDL